MHTYPHKIDGGSYGSVQVELLGFRRQDALERYRLHTSTPIDPVQTEAAIDERRQKGARVVTSSREIGRNEPEDELHPRRPRQ